MIDPLNELRVRAELLHHGISAENPSALLRLRKLRQFRAAQPAELRRIASTMRRKHCLYIIASELGFESWMHAREVLLGATGERVHYGKVLYADACGHYLNQWFANYRDAADYRASNGGTLLAYVRHFLVVEQPYLEALGLSGDDPDWRLLGFDWVRPRDVDARRRLYARRLVAMRSQS